MSRINTNVPSMLAQRVLGFQTTALTGNLQRLSTGLRINRGMDDPAGLVASENLRSEKAAISGAIMNAQRAEQVINIAEGGLQEISNLLVNLQSLVGATANEAGVSEGEREANQMQIDSILQTIDRLANSTSFQGTKLLNGNFDYTTSNVAATISDLKVNAARISNASGSYVNVNVSVMTSAQTGVLFLSTGANLVNNGNGSITFEVIGSKGVQQFTFASGVTQASIATAINSYKDSLGVSAIVSAENSNRLQLNSTQFGSSEFVRVRTLQGTSDTLLFGQATGGSGLTDRNDAGRDAVVLINGTTATTKGLNARVVSDGLDVNVAITGALNTDGGSTTFQITGGGANFNLSPRVDLAGKVSIGIQTVTTGQLGDGLNGYLSFLKTGGTANVVDGDRTKAQTIVESAIKQVSNLRGRLGAFQRNVVGATVNSLGVSLENTTAAESAIRDTDFAAETADLTRRQILTQASMQALALANAQPQMALRLLQL